jgi:two-component system sensor histidine kinase PhoQ
MPGSLARRLLLASALLLVTFLGLAGAALDHAFRQSSERATRDLLNSRVLGLLAAADVTPAGSIEMRGDLPEERFYRPGSGLYARILDAGGQPVWTSPSVAGWTPDAAAPVAPGERAFDRVHGEAADLARLRFGVEWELESGALPSYTVEVAESLAAYGAELGRFRREIGTWFAVLGIALVGLELWLLAYLLRPLGRAVDEISHMEDGRRERLSEDFPAEVQALTSRINDLVAQERSRTARYRETLDNLAHSLKTPLAVLRSALSSKGEPPPELAEPMDRIDDIVAYQLARASTTGQLGLGESVGVKGLAAATAAALEKVHADKPLQCELRIPPGLTFLGARGDLAELLGNLMDNGWKWASGRLRVTADDHDGLNLVVEDDGPGLPPDAGSLLERGSRRDLRPDGQGIGLAVVRDIAAELGGSVDTGASPLGGARIAVRLPSARVSSTEPPGRHRNRR